MKEAYNILEDELAAWIGTTPEQVAVCSSGTAAIHLALETLQLPPGSEVVMPDFSMVACARAVAMAGLTPVFIDCRPDLLMDLALLEDYVSTDARDRVSAVMLVHIYGRESSVDGTRRILARQAPNVRIVEDLAEAHGIKPMGDAAAWSFYKNKVVNCFDGEGGSVWFRNPEHAKLARQLRSLGFTDAHDFDHIPRGHNYRLANCLAREVLSSLRRVAGEMVVRRQIEASCDALCPDEWKMMPRDVPWVYDLRIPGMTVEQQNRIVSTLNAVGIPARHSFKPMSSLREFANCRRIGGDEAKRAAREVIYLPIRHGLTSLAYQKAFKIIREQLAEVATSGIAG